MCSREYCQTCQTSWKKSEASSGPSSPSFLQHPHPPHATIPSKQHPPQATLPSINTLAMPSPLQVFLHLLTVPLVELPQKEVEVELQESPSSTPRSSFSGVRPLFRPCSRTHLNETNLVALLLPASFSERLSPSYGLRVALSSLHLRRLHHVVPPLALPLSPMFAHRATRHPPLSPVLESTYYSPSRRYSESLVDRSSQESLGLTQSPIPTQDNVRQPNPASFSPLSALHLLPFSFY